MGFFRKLFIVKRHRSFVIWTIAAHHRLHSATMRGSVELFTEIRAHKAGEKLRYAGVSAILVSVAQVLIQFFGPRLRGYTAASLQAPAIVTVPYFIANNQFDWRVRPARSCAGGCTCTGQ